MKGGRVAPWLTYLIWTPSTQALLVLGVAFTPYMSHSWSGRLWHAPVILSQDVVGRVRWGDGRVLTMPYLSPYTATAPILSGETKPLWTRPSGHGGHAQLRCACVYPSIHLKSLPTVLSGRPRIEKSKENRFRRNGWRTPAQKWQKLLKDGNQLSVARAL